MISSSFLMKVEISDRFSIFFVYNSRLDQADYYKIIGKYNFIKFINQNDFLRVEATLYFF